MKHFILDGARVSADQEPDLDTIKALRAMIAKVKTMSKDDLVKIKVRRQAYGTRN